MKSFVFRSATLFALATAALSASAQNLVTNPGFETGDLTGYSLTGQGTTTGVNSTFTPHSGSDVAFFGSVGATSGIAQEIATVPGASYLVSFYLGTNSGDTVASDSFVASFGDGALSFGNLPATYSLYSFTATASGASTTLGFTGRNDPAYYLLDDVSVTRVQSTPEPASFAALGIGAMGLLRRRKRA